jgi:hypothetical protein
MPSPFPGMDPYLERRARWPSVQQALITYASAALNTLLPANYVADIGERLYIVQEDRDRSVYPDLVVVQQPPTSVAVGPGSGGAAVAITGDPSWVLTVHPIEIREVFIRILPLADEGRVVTVIEILSPSNKAAGSEGRQLYLAKQREILESETHLIEIDLLRHGEHTVAPPRDQLRRRGKWDYLVSLHRGGQGRHYQIWATTVHQRLPRIEVPLADGDPDVVLDLQAVFDRCYDDGAYARRLDYRSEPPVPMAAEDAAWANDLLREKALRE